jgi:hypothetical protein
VAARVRRHDPLAGHRVDAPVGERRPHDRKIARGDAQAALPRVDVERVDRVAPESAALPERRR